MKKAASGYLHHSRRSSETRREMENLWIVFSPILLLLPALRHLNPHFLPPSPSPHLPLEDAARSGGGTRSCLITNKENPFGCCSVGGSTLRSGLDLLADAAAAPHNEPPRTPHPRLSLHICLLVVWMQGKFGADSDISPPESADLNHQHQQLCPTFSSFLPFILIFLYL